VGIKRIGFSGYLLDRWFYRDSQWYLTIVRDGYHYYGAGHRSAVAFFPFYPLLVKMLNTISSIDITICAMIISNVAFLGALVYLHRLCTMEYGESVARRAVYYMAIFPTAFFSFAPIASRSSTAEHCLALLYAPAAMVAAGLFGGLAAATRILGVLLAIAFAWEYLQRHRFRPLSFRLDVLGAS